MLTRKETSCSIRSLPLPVDQLRERAEHASILVFAVASKKQITQVRLLCTIPLQRAVLKIWAGDYSPGRDDVISFIFPATLFPNAL